MGCLPSSLNKGRTATSAIGLFPKSFTTPNPPEAAPTSPAVDVQMPEPEPQSPIVLQTLREVSEAGPTGFPDPDPLGDSTPRTTDGEVMHATMTDVQKAIEQLGRHDVDGSRSFSFASSRGEGDGDWTDRDSATDTDGEADGWHLNARQRLAENSRVINEESAGPSTPMRISAPPIEVELSDESGAEDDERTSGIHDKQSPRLRHHPNISEEEEEANTLVVWVLDVSCLVYECFACCSAACPEGVGPAESAIRAGQRSSNTETRENCDFPAMCGIPAQRR